MQLSTGFLGGWGVGVGARLHYKSDGDACVIFEKRGPWCPPPVDMAFKISVRVEPTFIANKNCKS